MTVLGIETASDVCSVGLVVGDKVTERSIRETRVHSEMLLTLLEEVLSEAGVAFKDVEGLALSSGPGSFTGLRIGASTAKGLVAARPMTFVLVPTFDGIVRAYRFEQPGVKELLVCLDARQDEWYVHVEDDSGIKRAAEVMSTGDVLTLGTGKVVLTDAPSRFPAGFRIFDVRSWCRGGSVALLGRELIAQGRKDNVTSFEPAYRKEFRVRSGNSR